jgi:CheY-like chemotaxis protein
VATILIVEDDGLVARQAARALRQTGHTPVLAHDGRTALEEVLSHPDLILLDLGLPDLPGEEVLRRLGTQPRTAQIPVLVITGRRDAAARLWETHVKFADILLKPVSDSRLRQAVAGALETPAVQETDALRLDQHRRQELIRHLIVEGPDRLITHVYRRLSADRLASGGNAPPDVLTWAQIAEWGALEGLLDKDQAALLRRGPAGDARWPANDQA